MKRVLAVTLVLLTLTFGFLSCSSREEAGKVTADSATENSAITTSFNITEKVTDSANIEDKIKVDLKNVENNKIFYETICEIANNSVMNICYDFIDLDGNGDDELIVQNFGAIISDYRVYDNVGDKVELLSNLHGDIYIDKKGSIITLFRLSSENINYYKYKDGEWKYQNYSICLVYEDNKNPIYYIITDRDKDFICISDNDLSTPGEQFSMLYSLKDGIHILISDYKTDKASYDLALSELTKNFVQIEKLKYKIMKEENVVAATSSNR